MPTLKDQQREFSATTRAALLTTLQENPGEWFSAKELAEFTNTGIEEVTPAQIGGLLKFMRDDGLVESKPEMNINVWRLKRGAGATSSQIQAQAPAISAQGDLRPQNGHKPAPTHPYNVTPAVAKAPRPAPVTRPLPAHLESKPDLPKKPKAKTYADLRIAEIKGEKTTESNTEQNADESAVIHSWSVVVEAIEAEGFTAAITPPPPETEPMPEVTSPEIAIDVSELIDARPSESHEDEAPVTHSAHTCTGHCANHAAFSQADEEAQIDRLAAHQTLRARENYIVHLLTIADEHASTGDDLGCSPVWKTARRLAPVFGLEKTYA